MVNRSYSDMAQHYGTAAPYVTTRNGLRTTSQRQKPSTRSSPTMRKGRGTNEAPTKKQVSLRLSPVVLDHFKAGGPNWRSRIDEALAKIVKRKTG
ncbi:BrnA antitoxin family protein [Bradyrhizobium sp. USDA 4510]